MRWDSTLQAMSYAMEMVEEIEKREREVSDEGQIKIDPAMRIVRDVDS